MNCVRCDVSIIDGDVHLVHDPECDRALNGFCRCDGLYVCTDCCPECAEPTPLAKKVRAAHKQQQAGL